LTKEERWKRDKSVSTKAHSKTNMITRPEKLSFTALSKQRKEDQTAKRALEKGEITGRRSTRGGECKNGRSSGPGQGGFGGTLKCRRGSEKKGGNEGGKKSVKKRSKRGIKEEKSIGGGGNKIKARIQQDKMGWPTAKKRRIVTKKEQKNLKKEGTDEEAQNTLVNKGLDRVRKRGA